MTETYTHTRMPIWLYQELKALSARDGAPVWKVVAEALALYKREFPEHNPIEHDVRPGRRKKLNDRNLSLNL